jgi:hypothetical protein
VSNEGNNLAIVIVLDGHDWTNNNNNLFEKRNVDSTVESAMVWQH